MAEHQQNSQQDTTAHLEPSTIENHINLDDKKHKKKKGSKQVLVTISDSPLLQEHKVSNFDSSSKLNSA